MYISENVHVLSLSLSLFVCVCVAKTVAIDPPCGGAPQVKFCLKVFEVGVGWGYSAGQLCEQIPCVARAA